MYRLARRGPWSAHRLFSGDSIWRGRPNPYSHTIGLVTTSVVDHNIKQSQLSGFNKYSNTVTMHENNNRPLHSCVMLLRTHCGQARPASRLETDSHAPPSMCSGCNRRNWLDCPTKWSDEHLNSILKTIQHRKHFWIRQIPRHESFLYRCLEKNKTIRWCEGKLNQCATEISSGTRNSRNQELRESLSWTCGTFCHPFKLKICAEPNERRPMVVASAL